MTIRTVVRGVGSALPRRIMKNTDFEGIVETSDEWIIQRTGIRQRHIADDSETTASLGEAAALYWPDGPLTETTLRTAARDGRLPISQIAGKFFVTKAALRCLTVCKPLVEAHRSPAPVAATGDQGYLADLAQVSEMRRRSKDGAWVR